MEKGQYGYIKKHKKKIITSIIILGVMILTGVILSLVMFKTTKTLIIILPILISLPFAKQIVALIMCSKFKPLTEEEHKKIEKGIHYENRDGILYDISISRYEGMMFFPAVIVRDGRMLFLYQKAFDKKIPDVEFLKKEIARSFEMIKKPYVIITALTVDEFIKKAANRLVAFFILSKIIFTFACMIEKSTTTTCFQ